MSNISQVKNQVADSLNDSPWLTDLAFSAVIQNLSILND
jgi:hypothetical protein